MSKKANELKPNDLPQVNFGFNLEMVSSGLKKHDYAFG